MPCMGPQLCGIYLDGPQLAALFMTQGVQKMACLDSRSLLELALSETGRSKYAFARAAGMAPQSLNEYLKPGNKYRQMSPGKLDQVLRANGLVPDVSLTKSTSS